MFLFRIILYSCLIIFSGCSTSATPAKPNLDQLVYNPASMTKTLQSLGDNLSVQVLETGVQKHNYVRISAIKLADTPVIAAISQTKLKNKMFKDIIANADVTPIGTMLFAPNSLIKRRNGMQISQVKLSSIKNPVIVKYLSGLGYTDSDTIIQRSSQFYYQEQTLDLIEYVLPSINRFLSPPITLTK